MIVARPSLVRFSVIEEVYLVGDRGQDNGLYLLLSVNIPRDLAWLTEIAVYPIPPALPDRQVIESSLL